MKEFHLSGSTTFTKEFSIKIAANTYEEAEEKARDLLEDTEDHSYYGFENDDVDINFEEFESTVIQSNQYVERYHEIT